MPKTNEATDTDLKVIERLQQVVSVEFQQIISSGDTR